MQTTNNPIEAQVRNVIAELRKLRDEVRVQIHLAGMDAKKAWEEDFEPKLAEADRLAENATEEAYRTTVDMIRNVKVFRSTLPKEKKH